MPAPRRAPYNAQAPCLPDLQILLPCWGTATADAGCGLAETGGCNTKPESAITDNPTLSLLTDVSRGVCDDVTTGSNDTTRNRQKRIRDIVIFRMCGYLNTRVSDAANPYVSVRS